MRARSLTTLLGPRFVGWAAVILWAGIIFYLSSLSHPAIRPKTELMAKLAHVVEFAVLTLLLIHALASHHLLARRAVWIAALLALAYAATDEFHQSFVPHRNPSPLDVLIDTIGIGAVTIVAAIRRG